MEINLDDILDGTIDEFMWDMPEGAFNDFRKKLDCPDRQIALSAMENLYTIACYKQRQNCAGVAESFIVKDRYERCDDTSRVDKESIINASEPGLSKRIIRHVNESMTLNDNIVDYKSDFEKIEELKHDSEELNCAYDFLDRIKIPVYDENGEKYSIVGRIMQAIKLATVDLYPINM